MSPQISTGRIRAATTRSWLISPRHSAAKTLPEVVRDRLLREGYIRIDTSGIFTADRVALPSQVDSASADELVLNVDKDELLKRN